MTLFSLFLLFYVPILGSAMPLTCSNGMPHGVPSPVWLKGPGHPVELVSPNYPHPPNSSFLTCMWNVQAEWGSKVSVTVLEADMGSSCFSNILSIYDDSPTAKKSLLEYPGLKAQCGQSDFPPPTRNIVVDGKVTVMFEQGVMDQGVRFKVVVEATQPVCPAEHPDISDQVSCPDGPCCKGKDCCILHVGTEPKGISSPNYPHDSGKNSQCSYKVVAPKGSQVGINFLDMDMQRDKQGTCMHDHILLEDTKTSSFGILGNEEKRFCGQHLPNYPSPSLMNSVGDSMIVKYFTDASDVHRGRGFKANVFAINPFCNSLSYMHQYGDSSCDTTCAVTYPPPIQTPVTCDHLTMSITLLDISDPSIPISGAILNLTSVTEQVLTFDETLISNLDGVASAIVAENRNYTISVTVEGYLAQAMVVPVDWCHTEHCVCHPNITIQLTPVPPVYLCEKVTKVKKSFSIIDKYTKKSLAKASVSIRLMVDGKNGPYIGKNLQTNKWGKVQVTIKKNGTYKVSIKRKDYESFQKEILIDCDKSNCTSCREKMVIPLEKKTCKKIPLVVHVRDKTTDEPIQDAELIIKLGLAQYHMGSTNDKGKVFPTVPIAGMMEVFVNAKGYLPRQKEFNVKCDPNNCKKCRPVVVLVMVPIVDPCENKKVTIEVFDNVTAASIESALVNVIFNSTIIAENAHTNENGRLELPLNSEGVYQLGVKKESYDPMSSLFRFNCTDAMIQIPLSPEICQKTYFEVNVGDGVTKAPMSNVTITVSFTSSGTEVASYTTGTDGLAILGVHELEEYTITVTKDDYISHELQHTLTDCTTSYFFITLIRKPCDQNSRTISISVSDKNTSLPLANASASFLLTSNAAGPSDEDLGTHNANDQGIIEVPVSLFSVGHYSISVFKEMYLDTTFELGIFRDENCTNITAEIALEPIKPEPYLCERNKTLEVMVIDNFTSKAIPGAIATVTLLLNNELAFDSDEHIIGQDIETNSNGEILLPVNARGNYSISIEADGYEPGTGIIGVDCSPEIAIITIEMKPPCQPEFPVTILDSMTKEPIEDAQVTLALMELPSSRSAFVMMDKKETSEEGIVNFVLKENGKYAVKIEADGYITNETIFTLDCDLENCDCPISLTVHLKKEFCTDISLTVVVRETMQNLPLVGAKLSVKLDTVDGTQDISTSNIDDTGIVSMLLPANGFYTFKVEHPKYMTITEEREINIAMGECKIPLEPIFLPMTPRITCLNGVVVSLTWNEHPDDMDLYSFKVGQKDSSQRCLSYYCDGKDPCDCVKFDKDNKEGGMKGSETISYCCNDDASHMIYADDLSGKGAFMFNSGASLTITDRNNHVMKYDMNTNGMTYNTSQRYWLAGCLTFGNGNFEFLPVNRFKNVKPHEDDTLYCHHRVDLESESATKMESSIHVIAKNAISNLPVEGASVHVSLEGDSSFSDMKTTNSDGIVDITTGRNGKYIIRIEHESIITTTNDVFLNCLSNNPCSVSTLLSASPEMQPDNVRIIMNWMDQPADLDLYSFQVSKDNSLKTCLTSTHNTAPCQGVSMNIDNKEGGLQGSETISFYEVAENSRYTYMVFVDDKTEEGSALRVSKARLTITDSSRSTVIKMAAFDESTVAGARYWFAGCMMIKGSSYSFVPKNRFTKEKPSEEDSLECHNHFDEPVKQPIYAAQERSDIKVIVKDGLSNDPIGNATASFKFIDDDNIEIVENNVKTDENGIIILPVKVNGKYSITLQGDGYIRETIELTIDCDTDDCHKTLLISLSPVLEEDSVRLIMNWGTNPLDLDIHAYQVNINNTEDSCSINWMGKKNCKGVSLDLDNRNGGDEGAETITFRNISQNDHFVYMIYVEDHSNSPKQFSSSDARLTLTDGKETMIVNMEPKNYMDEKFWLAGCIRMKGTTYEFKKVGVFSKHSPREDVRLQCFKVFDISTVPRITLQGGRKSSCQGNVFVNGMPVCDDQWNNKDAQVIGKMMGLGAKKYKKCKAIQKSKFGKVPTNFIMDNVECTGKEKNILDCKHTSSEGHDCTQYEGAGVNCC